MAKTRGIHDLSDPSVLRRAAHSIAYLEDGGSGALVSSWVVGSRSLRWEGAHEAADHMPGATRMQPRWTASGQRQRPHVAQTDEHGVQLGGGHRHERPPASALRARPPGAVAWRAGRHGSVQAGVALELLAHRQRPAAAHSGEGGAACITG